MFNGSTHIRPCARDEASLSSIRAALREPPPPRVAPHNIEAEQALLGAILVNNEALGRVSGFLEPHHFYDPLHQQIFETCSKLIASGKQATPITLKSFFENAEPIDATLTVPQYLGRLAANAATIINARDYGRTIHDLATRRQLILIGEDLVNAAFDSPVDFPPKNQIEEAETRLFALVEQEKNECVELPAHDAMAQAIRQAEAAYQRGGKINGLATGIPPVDAKIGGLAPGDLVVLAGRPSMGKTALATNVAANLAVTGARVYFASLEMSGEQLGTRLLASRLGLSAADLRRGVDIETHMRDLVAEAQKWAGYSLTIDQSGTLTIAQLSARVRRAHRKSPLDLLIVDYLQLLRGAVYRGQNRTQEVAEVSGGLKAIAKELNIPVLALSQLSRATETREDRRPQLADLRDSGAIEQDADIVAFVHRAAYYLERQQPDPSDAQATLDWQQKMDAARGRAEVIIAKHRHGPTGIVELHVNERTMTFGSVAGGGRQ
jgi:replicative DNA helicase